MSAKTMADKALNQGKGILRLAPAWVPRVFCVPGRRIKLHPDDYFALGTERGGLDERWFSSTTPADNGPLTSENEGLSHVVVEDNGRTEKVLLRDAVEALQGLLDGLIVGVVEGVILSDMLGALAYENSIETPAILRAETVARALLPHPAEGPEASEPDEGEASYREHQA